MRFHEHNMIPLKVHKHLGIYKFPSQWVWIWKQLMRITWVTAMSIPIFYLIHCTASHDAAPSQQLFTVPQGAQHTSSSRAFWQRIHVSISTCFVQVKNIMMFLISCKVTSYASSSSWKAVIAAGWSFFHHHWVLHLAKKNSRAVCLVLLKWNMSRSSIWSLRIQQHKCRLNFLKLRFPKHGLKKS